MIPKIFHIMKKRVKLSDIQGGPIIHKKLPIELEERIRRFEPVSAEVYPISHDQWLDGFQRDLDPESEVQTFEAIARAYQAFLAKHSQLSLPAKKEAYGLMCSGNMDAPTRELTKSEAQELKQQYAAELTKTRRTSGSN